MNQLLQEQRVQESAVQNRAALLVAGDGHFMAELKELVVDIDPKAFIIVQEAHQVLGDGFSRYTKDSL